MALQQFARKHVSPSPPRHPRFRQASYQLLLSAIDKGWRIVDVELTLTKDRNGLIYIITLHHPVASVHRELILPRTALTENLLTDIRTDD